MSCSKCNKHKKCTKIKSIFVPTPVYINIPSTPITVPQPLVVATGSGSFNIPAGFRTLLVTAKGAGGGGGAGAATTLVNNVGGGGAGGGSGAFILGILTLGAGISPTTGAVTIGIGGTGAISDTNIATNGSSTIITINTAPITTITLGGGSGGGNGAAGPALGIGGLAGAPGTTTVGNGVFVISDGTSTEFLINPAISGGNGSGGANTAGDGGQGGFPPGTLISNVGITPPVQGGGNTLDGGSGIGSRLSGTLAIPCSSDPAFQPLNQAGIGGNGGGGGLQGDPTTISGCGGTNGTSGYVQLIALA